MYTKFNKNQAKYILENHSDLIGHPFDKELNITNILVIPTDQDIEAIIKSYVHEGVTGDQIIEQYANGSNLNVVAYSFDLIRMKILPHQDIVHYLSQEQLEIISKIEE